ncbi:MAG: ABC transporter [Sulfobacillus benefaciens]|uniref:ABC transporter n=1 Tax=Sulfobacillus benefaciens TaxID=453960 RepID=A0A2T2XAM6_9FIRM|nr:MAG: ABC transporter [Sulfobacillus benefaciens]
MNIRPNHLRRTWEIADVLARHGFVMVLDRLGLSRYLPWSARLLGKFQPDKRASWPQRLVLVLADLGPTYIKLGQLASTRPDLLPKPLIQALSHLQDNIPPFSFEEVRNILVNAWRSPIMEVLDDLDPEPLAAASIGQVHRGALKGGRRVVVKVRRPGIVGRSEADFAILRSLADVAVRRTEWARQYDLKHVVDELIDALRNELDFTTEAHYTALAHKTLPEASFRVPLPISEWTHPNVLVLEELVGVKISDTGRLQAMNLDAKKIAERYILAIYGQIFMAGLFHADPHPGNVHVMANGDLVFLDWGLVGMFSPSMRKRSLDLIIALIDGRSDKVAGALLAMGVAPPYVDTERFYYDVELLRRRYYDRDFQDFHVGQAIVDLLHVAQKYRIRLPGEYTLLARTAIIADGVVRQLDSHLSLAEIGRKLAPRLIWARVNPAEWGEQVMDAVKDWPKLVSQWPSDITSALSTLGRGEFRVVVEDRHIEKILVHWEKLVNRLAFSLLLGAIMLGTAFVVYEDHIRRIADIPVGDVGFFLVVSLVLWVFVEAVTKKHL